MTAYEFVKDLWEHAEDYSRYMTAQTAREDLDNFRRQDGWEVPEDLTAEEFADLWNELVDDQKRADGIQPRTIYLVYDVPASAQSGDWFEDCPTFDRMEALREAAYTLAHKTAAERARRRVYVGVHHVDLEDGDARTAREIYDDMLSDDTWPADHDVIEIGED